MELSLLKRLGIILAWLAIWELVALAIGNAFLFCGPLDVAHALASSVISADFWISIGWSFARIAIGFLVALALALALGTLAARSKLLAAFLSPLVHVVKSAPVVCIIAILLVLLGSRMATSVVVSMVVFPPVYFAMLEGHAARSIGLAELTRVFCVRAVRRGAFVDLPQYRPFLQAAFRSAVGMSWKAGIAAELIGLPGASIGEAVYLAKLSLDVPGIIAWTLVVIALGWISEKLVLAALDLACDIPAHVLDRRIAQARERETIGSEGAATASTGSEGEACGIELSDVSKAYGSLRVLDGLSLSAAAKTRTCLMAPSGSGKTTLLRIIAGLETADAGQVNAPASIAVVFQDTRLAEERTAFENLAITARDGSELALAMRILERLLGDAKDWEAKPVAELSGGMRRRVELARALAHPSHVMLLDEPFTGLDDEARELAASLVLEELGERALIVATHNAEDASLLDAKIFRM